MLNKSGFFFVSSFQDVRQPIEMFIQPDLMIVCVFFFLTLICCVHKKTLHQTPFLTD